MMWSIFSFTLYCFFCFLLHVLVLTGSVSRVKNIHYENIFSQHGKYLSQFIYLENVSGSPWKRVSLYGCCFFSIHFICISFDIILSLFFLIILYSWFEFTLYKLFLKCGLTSSFNLD